MGDAQIEFERGYVIAVANLVNMHGASTEAVDLMRALDISFHKIRRLELTEYDMRAILELKRQYGTRPFKTRTAHDAQSRGARRVRA